MKIAIWLGDLDKMQFHECKDKLKVGDIVYICDYRFNDIDNQPIRHISPIKVIVCSNDELPKNKTVYYSDVHFKPIGKNGKTQSRIIGPYDNTGYRAYTGVSLNIFYDKQGCIRHYLKQCKAAITEFERAMVSKAEYYKRKIDEIQSEVESINKNKE